MFEYKCMHLFSKTKCIFKYKCMHVNVRGYGTCKVSRYCLLALHGSMESCNFPLVCYCRSEGDNFFSKRVGYFPELALPPDTILFRISQSDEILSKDDCK